MVGIVVLRSYGGDSSAQVLWWGWYSSAQVLWWGW